MKEIELTQDPLWYKDAIIYELHIKAFHDSNDDGMGDFRGLIRKLDYLQDLGITAIWVLPFYPSPLRDDGYDIADYYRINPNYGSLRDFKEFLRQAHHRGIRVITELVINHTSDMHPWFQRARKARAGSSWRNYYVWSDTPDQYSDARIIFKDFEPSNWTWDPVAKAYYWHRFYSHQPDLNFDHPPARKELLRVLDHWFEMGVDGLRLDAVPYLFEREGTNCENLTETYDFLKHLRKHMDRRHKNRMLLAEANQWPEDAASYFGAGDCCHMAFHFPLMPRIFMAAYMEDSYPIVNILEETPAIPENCQWTLFLRNHDELTLEMVTDEERDYMYRVFADDPVARINLGIRRRLAPLLQNNRRKVELVNAIIFSLPGTPVIYYGDEIGMGDNYYLGDRDGVRTPMQWSADRNAGFSRANPQRLYLPVVIDPEYHYEAVNVEAQERNHTSLLWWMKRLVAARKRYRAFGRGALEFVRSDNSKILSFVREHDGETILVVINLSQYPQAVELDLSKFRGVQPEEIFSGNDFPMVRKTGYSLTVGAHDFYWLILKRNQGGVAAAAEVEIPAIAMTRPWERGFTEAFREKLAETVLEPYLRRCRWFGGKARRIKNVSIRETIPVGQGKETTQILFVKVAYREGEPETYLLPLAFSTRDEEIRFLEEAGAVVARFKAGGASGALFDGVYNEAFRRNLFRLMTKRHGLDTEGGRLTGYPGRYLKTLKDRMDSFEKSQVLRAEQSNTAILYGNDLFFKLYRKVEKGINSELEICRLLSERSRYPNTPPFAGGIGYRGMEREPYILGVMQAYLPNQGSAWDQALDHLGRYYQQILTLGTDLPDPQSLLPADYSFEELAGRPVPDTVLQLIGTHYLDMMGLLGERTAELHTMLALAEDEAAFAPESFSLLYQRSLYQSFQSLARSSFELLRKSLPSLSEDTAALARRVLSQSRAVMERFRPIYKDKLKALKIRIHGDYHLGQVLIAGSDFLIIDFEGEPAKSLSERRLKRGALRDVAGMVRSFHYAARMSLEEHLATRKEDAGRLEIWAEVWARYVSAAFFRRYLLEIGPHGIIPAEPEAVQIMMEAYLMNKVLYEITYELNSRPDWVSIPLHGLLSILGEV